MDENRKKISLYGKNNKTKIITTLYMLQEL